MIKCVDCGKMQFEAEGSDMYKNNTEVLTGYCHNCKKEFTMVRIKTERFREGDKVRFEVDKEIKQGVIAQEGVLTTYPDKIWDYDDIVNLKKIKK